MTFMDILITMLIVTGINLPITGGLMLAMVKRSNKGDEKGAKSLFRLMIVDFVLYVLIIIILGISLFFV